MFRRSTHAALLTVLVLVLAARPALAAESTPSSPGTLVQLLEGWLAHWAPWAGGDAASWRATADSFAPSSPGAMRAGFGASDRTAASRARYNPAGRVVAAPPRAVPKCGGAADPIGCH